MNGDQGLLYKSTFLRPVVDVPLIIRPPGDDAPGGGRVQNIVAELMDVGATIADYAGADPPTPSCARSLRPCIEEHAGSPRSVAVSEDLGHSAVTDASWKAEFTPDGEAVLLFDRDADPAEQRNLVNDPAGRAIVQRLADIRSDFLAATPASPIAAVDVR